MKKGWRSKKVWKVLTNKFFIAGVLFLAWMMYFDQNDLLVQRQRQKELKSLKDNIAYLNTQITQMEKERNELLTNPQELEKFGRENYHLKHDNEDIYVIEHPVANMPAAEKK